MLCVDVLRGRKGLKRNEVTHLIFERVDTLKMFLIFTTRESAHQKLATLSSKSPRPNGNILAKTCKTDSVEVKNGRKQTAKVTPTTTPILST